MKIAIGSVVAALALAFSIQQCAHKEYLAEMSEVKPDGSTEKVEVLTDAPEAEPTVSTAPVEPKPVAEPAKEKKKKKKADQPK